MPNALVETKHRDGCITVAILDPEPATARGCDYCYACAGQPCAGRPNGPATSLGRIHKARLSLAAHICTKEH